MNQRLVILAGVIVIVAALLGWWMWSQPQTIPTLDTTNIGATEESEVLGTSTGVDATLDAESERIDDEMKATSTTDFSGTTLQDVE